MEVNALHVLLTNDDGHAAPGIAAMRNALRAHGHRVSMIAPSDEQSAASMSTTMGREMGLQRIDDDGWHLDARPADTVMVALRRLLEDDPPDLVVSGINFGPNLGLGLHASGTVAAAAVGMLHGLPAIAVSAGMLFEESRENPRLFPSTMKALDPAAEFTCDVIRNLSESGNTGDRLIPPGLMLNINYPPLPPEHIRGVSFTPVSRGSMIEMVYDLCGETGRVTPSFRAGVDPAAPEREDGDIRAHLEGYITISPVRPDWNPPESETSEIRDRLADVLSRR